METKKTVYGRFASIYDLLSTVYSFGGISKLKRMQVQSIKKGERVLFAGAGGGEDALLAARKGASVVVVELSSDMIEVARKRIQDVETDKNITFICDDIMNYRVDKEFDRIYCNFFLNVFSIDTVPIVIKNLLSSLKDNGEFVIGDFACTKELSIQYFLQVLYFGVAAFFFVLTAKNPLHKLYDYRAICSSLEVELKGIKFVKVFNFTAFMTLAFKKKS